jgi:hypothetical protein
MSFQTQLLQYLQRERSPTNSISNALVVPSTIGTGNQQQQARDDNGIMQQNLIMVS